MRTGSFLRDFIRCLAWTMGIAVVAVISMNRADATSNSLTVAPITCSTATSCRLDWYSNHNGISDDYWMASNGRRWVRLTLAPGMSTTGVGRITCTMEDSCIVRHFNGALYAAQSSDGFNPSSKWVRLTMVNGR